VSYKVIILSAAEKEILRLNYPEYDQVSAKLRALPENPRPSGCRKLHGSDGWRLRVGRYRIVYEIDDARQIVTVLKVAHRKDVYR
jgi:mRNA interferase RelE/StbE